MINALIFSVVMLVLPVSVAPAGCEWVGPRIDGISVEVCSGEVRAYRDGSGYVMDVAGVQ